LKTGPKIEYNTLITKKEGIRRMMRLDQKAEILMKYFREGKSQRKISEELNISRTTVKKYVNEFENKNKELEKLKSENKDREKRLRRIEKITEKTK